MLWSQWLLWRSAPPRPLVIAETWSHPSGWAVALEAHGILKSSQLLNQEAECTKRHRSCTRSLEQDRGLAKATGPTVCRSGSRTLGDLSQLRLLQELAHLIDRPESRLFEPKT